MSIVAQGLGIEQGTGGIGGVVRNVGISLVDRDMSITQTSRALDLTRPDTSYLAILSPEAALTVSHNATTVIQSNYDFTVNVTRRYVLSTER